MSAGGVAAGGVAAGGVAAGGFCFLTVVVECFGLEIVVLAL